MIICIFPTGVVKTTNHYNPFETSNVNGNDDFPITSISYIYFLIITPHHLLPIDFRYISG